ncbi:hypothetical protein ITJ38_05120 [Agreia pratensis]|uniref:Uncharacterized protein n=1 Tax=Agreia pratensis TaxID=150121 RepID=A0A1X7KZ80_9MICO|nr:hypothetical protein [Agreia pratensis]MBF4633782.1 hypothetical protein [Agreia pratensis]SMG46657.1 hypothetical protein SAMN06296010_3101 [Agreia pratensis]
MSSRLRLVLVASLPAVVCALIGLLHPHHLTDATASIWQMMHLILIPLFPLVGLGPWLIARRSNRLLGWIAAVGGYGFATFYTSLDLLAGVAAGTLQVAGVTDGKAPIYEVARTLGLIGVISLVLACVAATVAVAMHARLRALVGGVIAVIGACLVQPGHIYPGLGTAAMLLLAAGLVMLALAATSTNGSSGAPGTTKGPATLAGPS